MSRARRVRPYAPSWLPVAGRANLAKNVAGADNPWQEEGKSMSRIHLIFLVVVGVVGCAETPSQQAFTPRRPAQEVLAPTGPNQFAERDHALAESLDRSLQALEEEPTVPSGPGVVDKESSTARDVHPPHGRRGSARDCQKPPCKGGG